VFLFDIESLVKLYYMNLQSTKIEKIIIPLNDSFIFFEPLPKICTYYVLLIPPDKSAARLKIFNVHPIFFYKNMTINHIYTRRINV
jgi:hypothetical protein